MGGGPSYQTPYPVTRGDGSTIIWDWGTHSWGPYKKPSPEGGDGAPQAGSKQAGGWGTTWGPAGPAGPEAATPSGGEGNGAAPSPGGRAAGPASDGTAGSPAGPSDPGRGGLPLQRRRPTGRPLAASRPFANPTGQTLLGGYAPIERGNQ